MANLKCLVSGITDGILRGVIKSILDNNNIDMHEFDIEHYDQSSVEDCDAGYVIVDMKNKKLPSRYRKIFEQNKNMTVIELLDEGRGVAIFMDDVGDEEFKYLLNQHKRRGN